MNCRNQEFTGVHHDGGYAEVMIAKASGLMAIPSALSSVDAAPLLCAGLTTFSALRSSPARAGDLVAVLGIGGLGHLGVQYARRMGFEVVAIGRGPDKDGLAGKLGAHHYIDSSTAPVASALQDLGGAHLVVVTASVSGHQNKVYEAMGHGALDAVDTPVLRPGGDLTGAAALPSIPAKV